MGDGIDERDAPVRTVVHELGQALDELSVAELDARVLILRAEIERLEAARRGKQQSREAASAFFKPPAG